MGGLTVLKFCLDHPELNIRGVIFSSALFRLHHSHENDSMWLKRIIVQSLSSIKEIFFLGDIDPTELTRDHKEVVKIMEDRLCAPMMGLRLAKTLMHWPARLFPGRAAEFKYPVLIVHGKKDRLTDPEASEKFYQLCSSNDKTLQLFEHSYHEVHKDINREEMFSLIVKWMKKRAENAQPFGSLDEQYTNPLKSRKRFWKGVRKLLQPFKENFIFLAYFAVALLVWMKYRRGSALRTSRLFSKVVAVLRCLLWPAECLNVLWKGMMA
eukprot:Platyproteum_vivax@DN5109_c0_g1_i1.p1